MFLLPFRYWFQRKRDTDFKPVILITGCGSGIGWALAELFYLQETFRVVVTARRGSLPKLRERFKESDRFLIRELDVTDEHGREGLVEDIHDQWGSIDILVNNAGLSYRAVVEHMTERDEHVQMNTNYLGPIGLVRLVLPKMREAGRGKIIAISSVSGMLAMPTMASYSASKYALEGASEALWYEMKPLGINVSLIQPGFIRSNSFERVYHTHLSDPNFAMDGAYRDYYSNMSGFVAKLMRHSQTTPEAVAKLVLRTIKTENPPLWIPATLDAFLFYYLRRMIPRRLLLPFLFWCLPNSSQWANSYSHRRGHVRENQKIS